MPTDIGNANWWGRRLSLGGWAAEIRVRRTGRRQTYREWFKVEIYNHNYSEEARRKSRERDVFEAETGESFRETYADDSGRGQHYPDDRTVLAHVYDGLSLRAILTDAREVERYREETTLTVSLTPAGEVRVDGAAPETVAATDPRIADTSMEGSA